MYRKSYESSTSLTIANIIQQQFEIPNEDPGFIILELLRSTVLVPIIDGVVIQ